MKETNRMGFYLLVVLTGFLGIASCDIVCMQFQAPECINGPKQQNRFNLICNGYSELIECMDQKALECDAESEPTVKDIKNIYTDACTHGTEMNTLFEKHKNCIFLTSAAENAQCRTPMLREVLNVGEPDMSKDYEFRALKAACKYNYSTNKCLDEVVNRTCGPEAVEVRKRISTPTNKLSDKACNEIGGYNGSAKSNESQTMIYILAVIFLLKCISCKYV